jgi:hypothetical protein
MVQLASRRAAAAIVGCVLIGSFALAGAATARNSRASAAITSLRVSGSSARPVFTITGTGLAIPKPNPTTSPSGQSLCPLKISGNAGLDYGTQLYLIAWSGQPASTNAALYSAGRYRPALNELDCIGIVVLAKSPTHVSFTLGHAYLQYYKAKPGLIRSGDVIEVVLNGAAFATVVRYG